MRSIRGSSLLGLSLGAVAATWSVGASAQVLVVPPSAKVGPVRFERGTGLCGQFMKATEGGPSSMAETADLLDGKVLTSTAQVAPPGNNNHSSAFFSVLRLFDYTDGLSANGGLFPRNVRFPWTERGPSSICTSQQKDQPSPATNGPLAMRARGFIEIARPGTSTFAVGADDGVSVVIGGILVGLKDTNSGITFRTTRASFAEAGLYPIEILYRDGLSQGELEIAVANEEIVFVDGKAAQPATPGTPNARDITFEATGPFPPAFVLLGDSNGPQLFLTDEDASDLSRCGATLGKPSDVCSLPGSESCGNGTLDVRTDGSAEACDDGNEIAGDGCSAACALEPGYVCNGVPGRCDLDPDGDGIGTARETALGLDPAKKDSDGDGVLDAEEHPDGVFRDTDGDGKPDGLDLDDDGDGILTAVERELASAAKISDDVDNDKLPNWRDPDADGDAIPDGTDGIVDVDKDGKPDLFDPADPAPTGGAAGQAGSGGAAGNGGAGQAGNGGAGQAGSAAAGHAGTGGAGQAGTGGAGQAGTGGAGQAGTGGAGQAGTGGAGQAGSAAAGSAGTTAGKAGNGGAAGRSNVGLGNGGAAGTEGGTGVGTGGGQDDSDGGCGLQRRGRSHAPLLGLALAALALLRRRARAS